MDSAKIWHLSTFINLLSTLINQENVRVEGLEPPRLAAPDPKSGASTNFATPAIHWLSNHYVWPFGKSGAKIKSFSIEKRKSNFSRNFPIRAAYQAFAKK